MKKKDVVKLLGITRQGFDLVLAGKRNFSFAKSKVAADLMGCPQVIWIDPDRIQERQDAWQRFRDQSPGETSG